jgi:putative FmdB family regulatory protein
MVHRTMRQVLLLKCDFPEIAAETEAMPIYEYRCESCGHQQEFLQKVSDPPLTVCTKCGKPTFTKMVTAAGFQLKGSGWYATDFKNSGAKPAAKSSDAGAKSSDAAGESSDAAASKDKPATDTKSESAPAATPAPPPASKPAE